MGKREEVKFEKKPRDKYYTIDPVAVNTLVPHLRKPTNFIEPCAGDGELVRGLTRLGVDCCGAYDIEPQASWIEQKDCLTLGRQDADYYITNPPFTWSVLQPLMSHMINILPTWLLLPADFMHNVRMGPYMKQCRKVVSVGRMYWEENKVKGVENFCWYLFDKDYKGPTEFVGR